MLHHKRCFTVFKTHFILRNDATPLDILKSPKIILLSYVIASLIKVSCFLKWDLDVVPSPGEKHLYGFFF